MISCFPLYHRGWDYWERVYITKAESVYFLRLFKRKNHALLTFFYEILSPIVHCSFAHNFQQSLALLESYRNIKNLSFQQFKERPSFSLQHTNDFALYTEAIKFFNHSEAMVRIAVRTITLNVFGGELIHSAALFALFVCLLFLQLFLSCLFVCFTAVFALFVLQLFLPCLFVCLFVYCLEALFQMGFFVLVFF